jgi:Flp pilus assembly protein TadD
MDDSTVGGAGARLAALAGGRLTPAELEGMTLADAYSLADYGWRLLEQGHTRAAALVFEALALGNPRHAYFHALHGAALQRGGDADGALAAYARALEADPDETAALVNRAEILLVRDGDAALAEVVGNLERALALDPDATRAETRRARALAAAVVARGAPGEL